MNEIIFEKHSMMSPVANEIQDIIDKMNEPRPLPMGRKAFHEWSDRIIAGALLPNECGKVFEMQGHAVWDEDSPYPKFVQSQKFALANQLLHIGPTESHKPDAYFIHALRVSAIKQVAVTVGNEMRDAVKLRMQKEADEAKAKLAELITPTEEEATHD